MPHILMDARQCRRSWAIGKGGELTPAHANEAAHSDRVTAAVWHGGFLYTASADGFVKVPHM